MWGCVYALNVVDMRSGKVLILIYAWGGCENEKQEILYVLHVHYLSFVNLVSINVDKEINFCFVFILINLTKNNCRAHKRWRWIYEPQTWKPGPVFCQFEVCEVSWDTKE